MANEYKDYCVCENCGTLSTGLQLVTFATGMDLSTLKCDCGATGTTRPVTDTEAKILNNLIPFIEKLQQEK